MENIELLLFVIGFILLFETIIWLLWRLGARITYSVKKRRMIRQLVSHSENSTDGVSALDTAILYLRPFKADNEYINSVSYGEKKYNTIEALLTGELGKRGIPLAIGKPKEKKTPEGAKRIYVSEDESWQDVVLHYLKTAKLVVLYVDFTPGVAWEIKQAVSAYQEKLVLIPKIYGLNVSIPPAWLFSFFSLPTLFISLISIIYFNLSLMPKGRRGKKYYRMWNTVFGDYLNREQIDDSVCAVCFNENEPILFKASNGRLEERLSKVIEAIQVKAGGNAPAGNGVRQGYNKEDSYNQQIRSIKNQQSKLILNASIHALGSKGGRIIKLLQRLNVFAGGKVLLYDEAFMYKSWLMPKRYFLSTNGIKGVSPSEGIRYDKITKIEQEDTRTINIITSYVSGSFAIVLSKATIPLMPLVISTLNNCVRTGHLQISQSEVIAYERANTEERKKTRLWFYFDILAAFLTFWYISMLGGYIIYAFSIPLAESGGKLRKSICILAPLLMFAIYVYFDTL